MITHQYSTDLCVPRRALFLDPTILKENPGTVVSSSSPIADQHYFIVLDRTGDVVTLAPCSSKNRFGLNHQLGETDRLGHLGWKKGSCYVVPQIWTATADTVERAAHVDLSRGGRGNYVTRGAAREVEAYVHDAVLFEIGAREYHLEMAS